MDDTILMTTKEVARYLKVNEKKVYTLITENGLPATKITGKWTFPRHLVDQWLEAVHGAAAPLLRKHYDLTHNRVRENRNIHPSLYDLPNHEFFDARLLKRSEQILAQALERAP